MQKDLVFLPQKARGSKSFFEDALIARKAVRPIFRLSDLLCIPDVIARAAVIRRRIARTSKTLPTAVRRAVRF